MKRGDLFPSKYIKAEDLPEEVEVTIKSCQMEELQGVDGKKQEKGILYFVGVDKGLVLNATNFDRIADQHGDDTDNWGGKKVTLFAEPEARSESGYSARIKPMRPQAKTGGGLFKSKAQQSDPAESFGGCDQDGAV